jgi:hypothetical protein
MSNKEWEIYKEGSKELGGYFSKDDGFYHEIIQYEETGMFQVAICCAHGIASKPYKILSNTFEGAKKYCEDLESMILR